MVPVPTRLKARLAMCMTAARGTIGAHAYQIWWPMSRTISTAMAPGHTSGQTSTMRRRSPPQLRKSLRRNMHTLPPACTNLVWTDLAWKVDIQNAYNRPFAVQVTFSIYDKDEFKLDSDRESVLVPANELGKARGKTLVSPIEKANRMDRYGASLSVN